MYLISVRHVIESKGCDGCPLYCRQGSCLEPEYSHPIQVENVFFINFIKRCCKVQQLTDVATKPLFRANVSVFTSAALLVCCGHFISRLFLQLCATVISDQM